jgi:hypothetical protein
MRRGTLPSMSQGRSLRSALTLATCLVAGGALLTSCGLLDEPSGSVIRAKHATGNALPAGAANEDELEGCAEQRVEAALRPVHLLFMLDQSGSMGDGMHGSRELKWDPVTAALQAFFAEPGVSNVQASLTLFPPNTNPGLGPADEALSTGQECSADNYRSPQVSMRRLPEPEAFWQAIETVTPPNEVGSPTQAALIGVLAQATALASSDPGAAIAIVLVTDGDPYCNGEPEPIEGTVQVATEASEQFPVYVVGVGDMLGTLQQVASAGGTQEPFVVPVDDPERTRRFLLDAIRTIHGEVLPCTAAIPPPPAGRTFDRQKVAVEYVVGDQVTLIDYDETCSDREGWRYDNVDQPQRVELCDLTCSQIQRLQDASLRVLFACKNLIQVVK